MRKQIKQISWAVSAIAVFVFLLFLFNQLSQFYILMQGMAPSYAGVITLAVLALIITASMVPIVLILRFPRPLEPPQSPEEEIEFRKRIGKRFKSNAFLKSQQGESLPVEKAVQVLNAEAERRIKQYASTVFLTTAISQNGKLDALTVLLSQTKLVWELAHLYYQRPSVKDLTHLYANVGAATFFATQIEDIDISERMEPIINSLFKSMTGKSLPVIGDSASIVIDSLLEGSTNAFLTLRVGIIAKNYCSGRYFESAKKARLSAFQEASGLLGSIVVTGSRNVISGIIKATRNAGVKTIKGGFDAMKRTSGKISDQVVKAGKSMNPFTRKGKETLIDEI